MKLTIDIPIGYERDFNVDKFKDFFSRVIADINCHGLCGNYEKEIAEMFLEAFEKAIIGDVNLNAKVIAFCTLWRSQMRFRAVALRSITAARF